MTSADTDRLELDAHPETILYRDTEQAILQDTVAAPTQHLYVHGPRGTGKTLLVRSVLAQQATTYYLSCIPHDTQYKVLTALYERVTDKDINSGYHTAQLQQRLARHLRHTSTHVILDDLAFLLMNDGNDLLYSLSRLDRHTDLCIIGISTSQASLADLLDDRTYSSLRPRHLPLSPYSTDEAIQILSHWVETALPSWTMMSAALEYIAATTTNLTAGLHWLDCAAAQATTITLDVVRAVQDDAVQRYRDALLQEFTWHHTVLLEVIDQATDVAESITTGTVYDRYTDQCRDVGTDPLTARRISDFLTHLELLDLIDVTHHNGGSQGKTRDLRPTRLQEF